MPEAELTLEELFDQWAKDWAWNHGIDIHEPLVVGIAVMCRDAAEEALRRAERV